MNFLEQAGAALTGSLVAIVIGYVGFRVNLESRLTKVETWIKLVLNKLEIPT